MTGGNGHADPGDMQTLIASAFDTVDVATATPAADTADTIARRFVELDLTQQHERPAPIVSIIGKDLAPVDLATPGKLMMIAAPSGAAKSSVVAAIASAVMGAPDPLGFVVRADRCIWFDTEQEPYEIASHCRTSMRRAGMRDTYVQPDRVHVYPINGLRSTKLPDGTDVVDVLGSILQRHRHDGERGLMIVDGIADLVPSILDEELALRTILKLESLVSGTNWCIIGTLHENRAGSPRGWIGTEAWHRSSSTIGIERHATGRLHIHAGKSMHKVRRGNPLMVSTWISWDDETGMFTATGAPSGTSMAADKITRSMRQHLPAVFTTADILSAYREAKGDPDLTKGAADAWRKRAITAGIIENVGRGSYRFRDDGSTDDDE